MNKRTAAVFGMLAAGLLTGLFGDVQLGRFLECRELLPQIKGALGAIDESKAVVEKGVKDLKETQARLRLSEAIGELKEEAINDGLGKKELADEARRAVRSSLGSTNYPWGAGDCSILEFKYDDLAAKGGKLAENYRRANETNHPRQ